MVIMAITKPCRRVFPLSIKGSPVLTIVTKILKKELEEIHTEDSVRFQPPYH